MTRRLWAIGFILTLALLSAAAAFADGDFQLINMTQPWFDQDALVRAHDARVQDLGENGGHFRNSWQVRFEHLLWPSAVDMSRRAVGDRTITEAARRRCTKELGWILRDEFVPVDLADHLVGLREHGAGRSDIVLGRYRTAGWSVQVMWSGRCVGLLFVPDEAPEEPVASPEYALSVARSVFVEPRPEDEAALGAGGGMVGPYAFGSIRNPNARPGKDAPVGPGPWYGGCYITDGVFVFLSPTKRALKDGYDMRGRSLMRPAPPLDQQILLFDEE